MLPAERTLIAHAYVHKTHMCANLWLAKNTQILQVLLSYRTIWHTRSDLPSGIRCVDASKHRRSSPPLSTTMNLFRVLVLIASAASLLIARGSPLQPVRFTQTSANFQDTAIRYVSNSGICETTPGVQQMSGYIDIGTNMNMVFSLFSAH